MTQDFIRSSDLDLLLTCPQKYNLRKNEGLGDEAESTATSFGTAWHKSQYLWAGGRAYNDAWQEATKDFHDPLTSPKTKDKLLLGLRHYNSKYSGPLSPVSNKTLEQEFLIRIPGISIPVKGTIDIVANWNSNEGRGTEKWVVDYKTTSRLEGKWVERYGVSNQFKCYYIAAREEYPDLAGVLVDIFYVTKGVTTDRGRKGKSEAEADGVHLYRLPLRFSDFILQEWERTVIVALQALEVYKANGHYPLNAPTACGAYGTSCPFLDICACQNPDMREVIKGAFRSEELIGAEEVGE